MDEKHSQYLIKSQKKPWKPVAQRSTCLQTSIISKISVVMVYTIVKAVL